MQQVTVYRNARIDSYPFRGQMQPVIDRYMPMIDAFCRAKGEGDI